MELEIAASQEAVWRALTQPEGRRRWLNDADVRSTWLEGADITIEVTLEGVPRRDRGTVEVADAPSLLRYSLWNSISRRPDRPEHRSRLTFQLAATESGATRLSLVQEAIGSTTAERHVAFFWPVALQVLRDELEGRPRPLLGLG